VPQGESFNTFRDRIFEGLKRIADYGAAVPAIIVHNHVEPPPQAIRRYVAGIADRRQPISAGIFRSLAR
jgi:hypothetical protein